MFANAATGCRPMRAAGGSPGSRKLHTRDNHDATAIIGSRKSLQSIPCLYVVKARGRYASLFFFSAVLYRGALVLLSEKRRKASFHFHDRRILHVRRERERDDAR